MRAVKLLALFTLITVLSYQVVWVSKNRLFRNFYEVIPNQLYRSAQLFPDEFDEVIRKYKIKTIINLRGAQLGSEWYIAEKHAAQRNHIRLVDIGMGTHHVPHKTELAKLIEAFKTEPRPLLIHCRMGADRTGEAVALYEMIEEGKSKEEALQNLSLKYLHFALFTPSKSLFIENFKGKDWALHSYDPCKEPFKSYYQEGECN